MRGTCVASRRAGTLVRASRPDAIGPAFEAFSEPNGGHLFLCALSERKWRLFLVAEVVRLLGIAKRPEFLRNRICDAEHNPARCFWPGMQALNKQSGRTNEGVRATHALTNHVRPRLR